MSSTKNQGKRDRRKAVNAAALGVVAVAILGTVAFAATNKGDSGDGDGPPPIAMPVVTAPPGADPGCVIASDDGSKLWVAEDALNDVGERLDDRLTHLYGPGALNPTERLSKGLIGQPVDYVGHRVVVVVDPAKIDKAALQADLKSLEAPGIPIVVQAGCRSAEEITRALTVVSAMDWNPEAAKTTSYYLDDYSSTVMVTAQPGPALDALRDKLAATGLTGAVTIVEGNSRL